jgi:putative ABC transport system substrate-binding protein
MRRRELLAGALAAAISGGAARAQGVPVVGFLNSATADTWVPFVAAFRAGLAEAGYVEGRSVAIVFRWADGDYGRLEPLAAELVALRVSVIAATGGLIAARAALSATQTIPVVFSSGADPARRGIVASFSRPGGNATGINLTTSELMPKRLELLRDMVPGARDFAFLLNPANPTTPSRSCPTCKRPCAQADSTSR